MPPRQHFDSPPQAVHTLQVGVKADAVMKAAAVSGQHDRDPGISVVVQRIAQHRGLQGLIHALFPACHCAAFQQLNGNAFVLQTVPDVPQLRGNGADGDRAFDVTIGACEFQKILEIDAHPVTGFHPFPLASDFLSAD